MSKQFVTLSDLTEALKPLFQAISRLDENTSKNGIQISDIHRMADDISVKLDNMDQSIRDNSTPTVRAAGKKLAGRKGTGTKKTAKKTAVKKTTKPEVSDEPDAGGDDEVVDELDAGESSEVEEKKTTSKAKNIKKTSDKATPKAAAKPIKKSTAKPTKKASGKIKTVIVKKPSFNKMNYFRKEFERDESQFSKTFTLKLKKEIEGTEDAKQQLEGKTGDSLKKARAMVYYHYTKDNNPELLNSLRARFDAELAASESSNPVEAPDTAEVDESAEADDTAEVDESAEVDDTAEAVEADE